MKAIRWCFAEENTSYATILAALEERSSHPLAGAIVRALGVSTQGVAEPTSFREEAGRGLEGVIDGVTYRVGQRAFVEEVSGALSAEALKALEEGEHSGATCASLPVVGRCWPSFLSPIRYVPPRPKLSHHCVLVDWRSSCSQATGRVLLVPSAKLSG